MLTTRSARFSVRLALVALLAVALPLGGCLGNPRSDYDDFLARADRSIPDAATSAMSRLEDLNGLWFVNSLLAGGINLALRMEFTMDVDADPITLQAKIWLDTQTIDEKPILETSTTINPDGTFILRAEPLKLGPEQLPVDTTVDASVIMNVLTQSPDSWCGTATGGVDQPLMLDLAGSTFAALRDDGQTLSRADVAQRCPAGVAGTPDGGPEDGGPDAGPDGGDGGPVRPAAPALEVDSTVADISGQWYLNARLAGSVPLPLWLSLVYIPAGPAADGGVDGGADAGPPASGSLDGTIRSASAQPGTEALTSFTTLVDSEGRFELWIPDFRTSTMLGEVDASILLVGATLSEDAFCGAGAGQVRTPIMLDLEGTTFGAVRWEGGTEPPADPPDACP